MITALKTNEVLIIRTDTTTSPSSPTETESAETVVTEVATVTPGDTSVGDNQESSSHVKPENRDKVNCERGKYVSCLTSFVSVCQMSEDVLPLPP